MTAAAPVGVGDEAGGGAGGPSPAALDRHGPPPDRSDRLRDWDDRLRHWPEVVTAALLGTDRRPLPERLLASLPADVTPDAPVVVLDLAAGHRAAALTTAATSSCPAGAVAPPQERPEAPPAAHELLHTLLARGEPAVVTAWLRAAAERGLVVGYEHWPRLAALAVRSRAYDRAVLREVFGVRGIWLLRQHPQWAALADDQAAAPPAPSGDPAAVLADVRRGVPPAHLVAGALECPDPWPPELARMALWLLGAGALGADSHRVAGQLAHRLPLTPSGEPDGWAAKDLSDAGPPPVALLRTVATSVKLVERTVETRADIAAAFDQLDEPDPAPDQQPGAAP